MDKEKTGSGSESQENRLRYDFCSFFYGNNCKIKNIADCRWILDPYPLKKNRSGSASMIIFF